MSVGVLCAGILRSHGKIVPETTLGSQLNPIYASVAIGLIGCEDAILDGRYLQACSLIRQEMEALAQVKLLRLGEWRENRSPNVRHLEPSLRRLYDELSAAAHVARPSINEELTRADLENVVLPGPTMGTRYFLEFDRELARKLFSLHILIVIRFVEEYSKNLAAKHPDTTYTEYETACLSRAIHLMVDEGLFVLD